MKCNSYESVPSVQCFGDVMEIMGIERWDSFVEFLNDLKDEYYYKQVRSDLGTSTNSLRYTIL